MIRYGSLFLVALCVCIIQIAAFSTDPVFHPSIDKAMKSVMEAVPKAEADPSRPVYHFRPPANWMNDPNGTIFYQGWYHVFYQHNPYGDQWGHMHWGHARSRDLINWEHMPIALWPSLDQGENHVFSGCAAINDNDQLMLFYTSVGDGRPNEQWAGIDSNNTITWEKHPNNPLLSMKDNGGNTFGNGWRDPFIFHEAGRTFMVLGADTEKEAHIPIYESQDGSLSDWQFKGFIYSLPKSDIKFFECPNFFKVDDRWMLITSPYKPLEYYIGSFDVESLKFTPDTQGVLDPGNPGFYASNIAYDPQGRCIMFGWVRGFKNDLGWNGCMALPRLLSIGKDGHPRQQPIPELQKLRNTNSTLPAQSFKQLTFQKGDTHTYELKVNIALNDAEAVGIDLGDVTNADTNAETATIRFDGKKLTVAGTKIPFELRDNEKELSLHIFRDRSVIEVFVNDGRLCVTRVLNTSLENQGIQLLSEGASATVTQFSYWNLKSIW